MKTVFTVFLITACFFTYGQERYPDSAIESNEHFYVVKATQKPATGIVYGEKIVGRYKYKFEYGLENGLLDGQYTWKYENGKLQQISFYKEGKTAGPLKRWWMNGNKQRESTSEYDKIWYKTGELKRLVTYKNGLVASSKCWDTEGQEIECE
ncbi:MAG: hypothetical protein GY810_19180 [Aureispira sp.]|nr:hypothetical protein [Aureispira sp.]